MSNQALMTVSDALRHRRSVMGTRWRRLCQRKMQGASIRKDAYYRCIARTLAPEAVALADHPRTVDLREDHLLEPLNGWIGRLFDRSNVDRTVTELVASQDSDGGAVEYEAARKRLAEVETALCRLPGW